jgi:methionyl-tRNA synthetase
MLGKYFEGKVPEEAAFADSALEALRKSLVARVDALYGQLESAVTGFDLDAACETVMELVREANAFVNASAPFKLAKDPARVVDLRAAMHALCQVDFALCHALRPFVPDAAVRIAAQLGVSLDGSLSECIRWGALKAGHQTGKPEPLFARIEEIA